MISADADLNIQQINQDCLLTIANPTSAFFNAGPSLVPSPVTATTCLWSTVVLSIMPGTQTYTYNKQQ